MSVQPGDIYTRPSRDEIAARVLAQQPGARNVDDLDDVVTRREPEPEPESTAVANFAVHLAARMRVLGWDTATLATKCGLHSKTVARAVNGNGIEMAGAEKIAYALGGYLATMIGPYMCSTCSGEPPAGFACLECGAEARAA